MLIQMIIVYNTNQLLLVILKQLVCAVGLGAIGLGAAAPEHEIPFTIIMNSVGVELHRTIKNKK